MSDQQDFSFGKFVPGFDFLQNLTKGAQTQTALPNLSSWVAPTLNVEELDKRISELKAVHFWLDQNSKALAATVQALELQKMTLATLKGMNFNMADIANALTLKPGDAPVADTSKDSAATSTAATGSVASAAQEAVAKVRAGKKEGQQPTPASGVVDPMQWWGALTQQFQEIAAGAMKEVATDPAGPPARAMRASAGSSGGNGAGPRASAPAKTASRKSSGAAGKSVRKGAARGR